MFSRYKIDIMDSYNDLTDCHHHDHLEHAIEDLNNLIEAGYSRDKLELYKRVDFEVKVSVEIITE